MVRNVFKKLGLTSGLIISETTKGFKVENWSLYNDEPDKTYFIEPTEEFPAGFRKWNEPINEYGTKNYQLLLEQIRQGYIKPYRIITD